MSRRRYFVTQTTFFTVDTYTTRPNTIPGTSWLESNVHYLPIDLSPFGQDARGKLFPPTDEPSGQIEVTFRRE